MGRKKKDFAPKRKSQKKETSGVVSTNTANATTQVYDAAKVESEFADILNYQRKQENNLLGVFIGQKYKLSPEVIARLLALPKKFDRIENNIFYAATILGEFVLNFKIEMDIQPDFCKAKLFLIEIEQDVEDDIKHLTLLDEVTETYMFEFRAFLCQKWNIFYDDQVVEKDDKLYQYLHMQNEEFLFNRELVELLSQLYVVRMLAHLDGLGELGQKAQYEFKLMMEKYLKNDPSIAQNFTIQKKLLDFVLKKNNAFAEILKTEEGSKVLSGYSKPLVNIRDKTYTTVLESKKDEKKTEKSSSKPAAKGSVKKKSAPAKDGGGGGVKSPWDGYKAASVSGISSPKPAKKEEKKPPIQKEEKKASQKKDSAKGLKNDDALRDALNIFEQVEEDQMFEDFENLGQGMTNNQAKKDFENLGKDMAVNQAKNDFESLKESASTGKSKERELSN